MNRLSLSGFVRKSKFMKKLMPGIRLKFSFLIGVFVSFILASATYINYINQSSILSKSFNDETEKSLNYINPIVNSIDNIRTNLLLIEDMKIRVNEKSEDLKKYKTYSLRKKDSVANTFKSLGNKLGLKVRYDYYYRGFETYYSRYLSKKDITALEQKIASRLRNEDGSAISSTEFSDIQRKAGKVIAIQRRIDKLQKQLDENMEVLSSDSKEEKNNSSKTENIKSENRKIETQLASERKRILSAGRLFRNRLNRYYNQQLKFLDETGIYNSNIRVITYNYDGDIKSDTGSYFRESQEKFSPLFDNNIFIKDRADFFNRIDILASIKPHEFNYNAMGQYYHVRYVPVFKNPSTSQRLLSIVKELESDSGIWKQFLKEDMRISGEINKLIPEISSRLNILKENRKIPGKDGEFNSLYDRYRKLINERDDIFRKTAPYSDEMKQISGYYNRRIESLNENIALEKKKIEDLKLRKTENPDEFRDELDSAETAIEDYKEEIKKLKRDMEEAREDILQSDRLTVRNAVQYLRDAALFDYAILKQKQDHSAYRSYLRSSRNRDLETKRWATLREWIMKAGSETDLPESVTGAKKVSFSDDGVLAYSRSEVEEYMWRIDSMPIAGETGLFSAALEGGLVEDLIAQNITGFHGVFIDKTGGVENIARNRDRMIIYSVITALVAIVLTFFLAGFLVKRIRDIIDKARLAGSGDLRVEFPEKGLDEIEDLGVSLNGMIRGLREKEELKGEIAAAGEIQKILLPEKIPSNLEGYYSIGTFYRPMQGVGGDYYDFIELDDESIFFCIADVSSHGVGPAIVMSMLRAHIHGILRRGVRELKELLLELNRQIFTETPPNIFVTIFTGVVNRRNNEIDYCSAGHLKPVVYRYKSDRIEILEGGGLPVGMDDNDIFADTITVKKLQLKPGDIFYQYTDGVSEAMDSSRKLFGEERMYEEIKKYSKKKPEVMITKIAEAVETFTGKTVIGSVMSELNDDIAMIALKRIK